jgi:flagellar hook assembly protein FlgD
VLRTGVSGIGLAAVDARDARNQRLGEDAVVARAEATAPDRTLLLAPRPNPVRDGERSLLEFSLASRGPIELVIYGVDGRRVRTLVREEREAGVYREGWDGRDDGGQRVGSGIYYARLVAGPVRFTQAVSRIR